ncbi:uncharacterized protein MELLADRAFT_63801 [Melampsora larici-populina 98AG31]|uniref:Uncharacterized protein n=1 Tax=Melampsora larici-populina (strain 98AG31 / pathotype 3-4-7) TaxID=747676 RepID=F4RP68_MELLP|nr:uncharacterized protein MELLADRAFT_63801 [Melampsora larici-populina 98AG31]EGG05765.1 hypothetical protein MELLADRAFT_63801 [Melampsora larici-populina 98AG31]
MNSHMTSFSGIPQRDAQSNLPAHQGTPMPMSYYVEVLLSLSKVPVNPATDFKSNLTGRHLDPILRSKDIASSDKSSHQTTNASTVRKPRTKISLTECARKMERSYRGIAHHATEISDTLRDRDPSRVHKRERTITSTNTPEQKLSKKRTRVQPARAPRSGHTSSQSYPLPTLASEPSRPTLKPKIRLCLANQIKYCNLVLNDQDLKENVPYGSSLGVAEVRKILMRLINDENVVLHRTSLTNDHLQSMKRTNFN